MNNLTHLRALQAFEAVGRCGTVTAAANELHVSPGAISQQIRRIEDHLGILLLERHGRSIQLTTWGKLYHAELAKGFDQLRHAHDVLRQAQNQGRFVVSSLTTVVNKWLGRTLFTWSTDNTDVALRLVGTEIDPTLDADGIDFRVFYGDKPSYDNYTILFTDCVVPVCSPLLLKGRMLTRPAEIFDYPLFEVVWNDIFAGKSYPRWRDWAELAQCPPPQSGNSPLVFALSSNAIDAAASGRGFALAQVAMIQEELESGRLIVPFDIRIRLGMPYGLAWNRAALDKPGGTRLRSWLTAQGRLQDRICSGQTALALPPAG